MPPSFPRVGLSVNDLRLEIVLDSDDNIEICLEFLEIIRKKTVSLKGDLLPSKCGFTESDLMDIAEVSE